MSPARTSTRSRTNGGQVSFVGAGPGDPGLLTLRAAQALAEADVVVVDHMSRLEVLGEHCREGVEVVHAGFGEDGQPLTRAARARMVVRAAKGRRAVRVLDGDVGTFTGLADEMAAVRKAGLRFDVVPGVSAVGAVPAYAGVAVASATDVELHVVHGNGSGTAKVEWSRFAGGTVVVLGAASDLVAASRGLVAAGREAQTPVVVTSQGTTPSQRSLDTTLAGLVDVAAALEPPLTAVVGRVASQHEGGSWYESKPLFGWRVLVPRTKDQAGGIVRRLADHGATSDVVPTISVEPPRTPHQLDKAVRGLVTGRYEWIGFTSVNAVKAIRDKFVEYGLDARAFSGLKVAAVGGVTADALREWGIEPDLVPSGVQSADGLLADWPAFDEVLDPINRVFLPRADIATDTLVAGLKDLGWETDDVTAYRTVRAAPPAQPVREAIKNGSFDAVVFTSSSTVRNLVGIAGKPHVATVVACIGPATAKTAEEHGLRVDVMAAEPSADALADALADHGLGLRSAALEAGEPPLRPSERRGTARRRAT